MRSVPGTWEAGQVSAGIAVFDREAGRFTERRRAGDQFRAASVVKLLIALDHLWDRGPGYELSAEELALLDPMLGSSDDAAATGLWARNGGSEIIARMVSRLGLPGTAGPPAGHPEYWGYTAITAEDTVRVYRFLLESAPGPLRELVLGGLRRATRHGTDGVDQFFGIPAVFRRPWAVKQGWSGFHDPDAGSVTGAAHPAGPRRIDLASEALHTTGLVGPGDRCVVAVLTLHPPGTPFATAGARVSRLARSLCVPGGIRA